MVAKHAWDKVVTHGSRSGWAIRLFAAAGTSFLLTIVGVTFSGGGLSRGILPEPMNTVVAVLTWVAFLSVVVLLPLAVLVGLLSIVRSWAAPAPATPDVGGLPEAPRDSRPTEGSSSAIDAHAADRRRQTALLFLVAVTIAAAYLWSETSANRSLEVMPFALIVLGSSVVFVWLIIRTK